MTSSPSSFSDHTVSGRDTQIQSHQDGEETENTTEHRELLEQHHELDLRIISTQEIHTHNRSRIKADTIGGYEWWQIQGVDDEGTGFHITIHNGDGHNANYRRALKRHQSGRQVNLAMLRPSAFPSIHLSVFEKHKLTARATHTFPKDTFHETPNIENWAISLLTNRFEEYEGGWRLSFSLVPERMGLAAVLRPGRLPHVRITGDITIQPYFHTMTLERMSMPTSPDGSKHRWLMAAPSVRIDGTIRIQRDADKVKPNTQVISRDNVVERIITLQNLRGAHDHFWGDGILGSGMRRWSRGYMTWNDGAVVTDLSILRKYIQLAGTIVHFLPNRLPEIERCSQPPEVIHQRGKWLLAYPVGMAWQTTRSDTHDFISIKHGLKKLTSVIPNHGIAITDSILETGIPPDEIVVGPMIGLFEIIQPDRADWWIWRWWQRRGGL